VKEENSNVHIRYFALDAASQESSLARKFRNYVPALEEWISCVLFKWRFNYVSRHFGYQGSCQSFLVVARKLPVPEMKAPRFLRAPLILSSKRARASLASSMQFLLQRARARVLFRSIFVSRFSDMSRDFIGEGARKIVPIKPCEISIIQWRYYAPLGQRHGRMECIEDNEDEKINKILSQNRLGM